MAAYKKCKCCAGRRHSSVFTSIAALPPLAERGPSLESRPIYRVSLTVDLWEGNKIISFKKLFHHSQLGLLKKKKIRGPWARAQCAHWLRRPCAGKPINREIHSNFSQY